MTFWHRCTLIPSPVNLMQDLISDQKHLCRARICGYQPRPRWSISRELAPVSPPAAGCEILTPLEVVPLTLHRTPGVFEASGSKKLHFKGKECYWELISLYLYRDEKTNLFYLEIWKDSKFFSSDVTASANITQARMRQLNEFNILRPQRHFALPHPMDLLQTVPQAHIHCSLRRTG